MMVWPPEYIRLFELGARGGDKDESRYYGPYNALLGHLFPVSEGFMVVPQYKRPEQSKSVDFTTIFVVSCNEHPIFFLEVKPSNHLHHISARKDADSQMRERFLHLFDNVEIDTLYGVSALGTRFCIYQVNTGSGDIEPELIVDSPTRITDVAPAARWKFDAMTAEGRDKLLEVVRHIKTMCS